MKSKVMGIASAAAVVLTVVGLALGSTFARASNQDIVDTAVGAGQFKTLAAALGAAGWSRPSRVRARSPCSRRPMRLSPNCRPARWKIC